MGRTRTVLALAGGAAAGLAIWHFRGSARGRETAGGVVMGDAAGYDRYTARLLGGFYRGIATDVAAAAPTHGRVLEVGCGPGHLSIAMAGLGLEVTGLDLDPAMAERARANAEHAGRAAAGPKFEVGDVAALPFSAGSFDLVVSTLSMHHWADPTAGLAEIGRVLRPGGRALVWDIRPGVVPLHAHTPDPLEHINGSALRVVSATPWRWPWRLAFTQRLELVPANGPALASPSSAIYAEVS